MSGTIQPYGVGIRDGINERAIRFFTDRLFASIAGECVFLTNPITGSVFTTYDFVDAQMEAAVRALIAREHFAQHGPADVQPLPLSDEERDRLKSGGVWHVLALFASSWEARNYDLEEHPPFDEYAAGVLASPHAPDLFKKDQELLMRFPPRYLPGLQGGGLHWRPPKVPMATSRRGRRH